MKTISSIFDNSPEAEAKRKEKRQLETRLLAGRQTAIKFLGLAKKPSGKVSRKLSDAGFNQEEIKAILQSLQENGFIDDEAVAGKLVRQRTGRKSEAKQALRMRLQQQGLSSAAIELALEDARSDQDAALDLIRSRFQDIVSAWPLEDRHEQQKQRLKIIRFMAGRGFNPDLANQALISCLQSDDD